MSDFLVRRSAGSPQVPRWPRAGREGSLQSPSRPRRGRAFVSLGLTLLAAAAFADSEVRQRAFRFSSAFPAGRCHFAPDSSRRCPRPLPFPMRVEVPRAGQADAGLQCDPPQDGRWSRSRVALSAAVSSVCIYHFRFTNGLRVCETLGCVRAMSFSLVTSLGSAAAIELENASLSVGLGGGSSQESPPTCVAIQVHGLLLTRKGGSPASIWANPSLLTLICEVAVAGEWEEWECINW